MHCRVRVMVFNGGAGVHVYGVLSGRFNFKLKSSSLRLSED